VIKVITWWDTVQLEPEIEWRMWRQLRGAFDIQSDNMHFLPVIPEMESYTFHQHNTLAEALAAAGDGVRCFLEPGGTQTVADMPAGGDIILILGSTSESNAALAQASEMYRIDSPAPTDLYGVNAAAIALAIRHGQ
jgi:hypothetical protein